MRLSPVLFKQHLGRMFKAHWKVHGKRVIRDNGALRALQENGLEFEDAVDFVKERKPTKLIEIDRDFRPEEVKFDQSHPDYHEDRCFVYGDGNVLLEGLRQAQVLTNSVVLDGNNITHSTEPLHNLDQVYLDKLVKRCVRSSLLFDAYQEKLPKKHDPAREAWIFPRYYGIVDRRRNLLLCKRLLQLCSALSPQLLGQRAVLDSATFSLPFDLPSGQRLLFTIRGDEVVLSNKSPAAPQGGLENSKLPQLPDISPLLPTVSLEKENIYKYEPHFPIKEGSKLDKVHTVLIHYNETEVNNIFETPVTMDQILGRSLVHSWVYAMSQAGKEAKSDEAVRVQTVQTDGKFFHFGVMELRSRQTDDSSRPNLFWSLPVMNMFEQCDYSEGRPVLEGYNPKVFDTLLTFYHNT